MSMWMILRTAGMVAGPGMVPAIVRSDCRGFPLDLAASSATWRIEARCGMKLAHAAARMTHQHARHGHGGDAGADSQRGVEIAAARRQPGREHRPGGLAHAEGGGQ